MTSHERQFLLDILIAAEDARSFTRGIGFDEFVRNAMVRRAVLHCLAVIGEAAGYVPNATESDAPDLAWRKMKNLRNVIIHNYEGVDLVVVWKIATDELPKVVDALSPLFPERER